MFSSRVSYIRNVGLGVQICVFEVGVVFLFRDHNRIIYKIIGLHKRWTESERGREREGATDEWKERKRG